MTKATPDQMRINHQWFPLFFILPFVKSLFICIKGHKRYIVIKIPKLNKASKLHKKCRSSIVSRRSKALRPDRPFLYKADMIYFECVQRTIENKNTTQQGKVEKKVLFFSPQRQIFELIKGPSEGNRWWWQKLEHASLIDVLCFIGSPF